MPQELIELNVRRPVIRVFLILLLLIAGVWSYFAVRWYLGNTLAEYFNPAENNLNIAHMATSLAPDDPLTHWRVGQVAQKVLPLDQQAQAIAEYEKAVSLSPQDYRFWMSLGTAHGRAGDITKAELALKRAVELAPAYAYPRWYLGNLLLRNNRYDEAFAELRIASDADPDLRPQLFNLIWQVYNNDPEALKNAVGQSSEARAQFALYLIAQNRMDDGLRFWNSMSEEEKKTNRESGESIVASLKNAHRYHDALKLWNEIAIEKYRAQVGRVFDGSFEEAVSYGPEVVFGWHAKGGQQLQIGIDPQKSHAGARSLRLVFNVRVNLDTVNISQLVPVLGNSVYDFEYYLSTEKLETGSAPQVQVVDAADSTVLVSSAAAPNGTNDWNRVNLSFKTGEKTQAVILKIVRFSCSTDETPICPIFGSIWYDDFSFKRRN